MAVSSCIGYQCNTRLCVEIKVKHSTSVTPSLISLMVSVVSVDVKHHVYLLTSVTHIVQELCESRGGRPGLSVLTSLLVSVDVKNY